MGTSEERTSMFARGGLNGDGRNALSLQVPVEELYGDTP